jgi:hypothetical protein
MYKGSVLLVLLIGWGYVLWHLYHLLFKRGTGGNATATAKAFVYLAVVTIPLILLVPSVGGLGFTLLFPLSLVLTGLTIVILRGASPKLAWLSWKRKGGLSLARYGRRLSALALLVVIVLYASFAALMGGGSASPQDTAVDRPSAKTFTVVPTPAVVPSTSAATPATTATPPATATSTAPAVEGTVDTVCKGGPDTIPRVPPTSATVDAGNLELCWNGKWQGLDAAGLKAPLQATVVASVKGGSYTYAAIEVNGRRYVVRTTAAS